MTTKPLINSNYVNVLLHLFIGILFGAGLAISEMANPNAVLSFLDVSAIVFQDSPFSSHGNWNPGLIFVMLAAIAIGMIAYGVQRRMKQPKYDVIWRLPSKVSIDKTLIGGASLFGIGWGLAGYCPGPAVTALINNPMEGVYFIGAMLAGSYLFQLSPLSR